MNNTWFVEYVPPNTGIVPYVQPGTGIIPYGMPTYSNPVLPQILENNPAAGSLSTYQTRIWYKWQESLIGSKLDYSKPLEEVAKDAFEMRNTIRTQARVSMSDQAWAEYLMQNEKNMTFEQLAKRNIDKGLTGDELWNKIIQSSMSSRDSVNSLFQLD